MADKPAAEFTADKPLVRRLLRAQGGPLGEAAGLPLAHAEDGWDCSMWRLGENLAVRLPRRAVAVPLIEKEQRFLPDIAARLAPTQVPAPIVAGVPGQGFGWPWSVVPWFAGQPGLAVSRHRRTAWAEPLAQALTRLHVPALGAFPPNPYRGVPLAARHEAISKRLVSGAGGVSTRQLQVLADVWEGGLAAPQWDGPPLWIHGDLHPGNLIARGGELVALIDFGDMTAGDPAYDLAVAWLAFDEDGRQRFCRATGGRYDHATWGRARAWAAAITLILLQHSDDNPAYHHLATQSLAQLTR